jgi:hypothetical protein
MSLGKWKTPLLALVSLLVASSAVHLSDRAPADVVPATALDVFSAERAFAHLHDLLQENVPHPAGSAANAVVGDRILEKLRQFGYTPETQEALQCSTLAPGCAFVRNIIAVKPGRESDQAVMVTAHYDSVPGSVAAADDGAGVAVMLELAERLAKRAPLRHDIVFLFTDGEESGLRGAMLFAEKHPLMRRIGLVLNMEARGASGPALMFETSEKNARLIDLMAAVPRPVTNSMLFEVYRRMPNDTDYSIYKRAGVPGMNFAFARGASLYHSVRDDLERLDRKSLQHMGESVSAVLMRAGETDWSALVSGGDATYIDIGALTVVRWPSAWNLPLAMLGFALVVVLAVWRAPIKLRSGAWALLAIVLAPLIAVALGWVLSWPLGHWPDAHPLDHPYPWPGRIALIAAAVLTALVCARWIGGARAGSAAMLSLAWLAMAALAIASSVLMSGATYVFVLPVLAYTVVGLIESLLIRERGRWPAAAAFAGFFVAAYLALYHFGMFETVLGFKLSHLRMIVLAQLIWTLLPLTVRAGESLDSRIAIGAAAAACALAAVIAMNVPSHTVDRPRGANLVYVQEGDTAQWQMESFGGPGKDTLRAMGFDLEAQAIERYGVAAAQAQVRSAKSLNLPQPTIEIDVDEERGGQRVLQGRIRSERNAYTVGFTFASGVPLARLAIENQPVLLSPPERPQVVRVFGAAERTIRFEIAAPLGASLSFVVFDDDALTVEGEAAEILAKRPDTAAPLQFGDHSIVVRRVTL